MSENPQICSARPLTSSDFEKYDTVADGRLMLNDFAQEGALETFLAGLIQTDSRSTFEHFVYRMSTGLKNDIGTKLSQILSEPPECLDESKQEKLKTWLANEFQQRRLSTGASLTYTYDHTHSDFGTDFIQENGFYRQDISSIYKTHSAGASTWLNFQTPVFQKKWQLHTNASFYTQKLKSDENSLIQLSDENGEVLSEEPLILEEKPLYLMPWAQVALAHNQDKAYFSLQGSGKKYFQPLPNQLNHSLWLNHQARGQELLPHFSASYMLEYSAKDYASPIITGQQQKTSRYYGGNTELSYQPLDRFSIYTTHTYSNQQKVESYENYSWQGYQGLILPHFDLKKGYVRLGAGGEWNDNFSERFDNNQVVDTQSAGVNLFTKAQYQPSKTWTTEAEVLGAYQYAEGTFNGWYPELESDFSLQYANQKFVGKLGYGADFYQKQLYFIPAENEIDPEGEISQRSQKHSTHIEGKFTPLTYLEFSAWADLGKTWQAQNGFRPKNDWFLSTGGKVFVGLPKNPAMRLVVWGEYNKNEEQPFYFPSSDYDEDGYQLGVSLMADNVNLLK